MNVRHQTIDKLETGVPGFDGIALGGLPRGKSTLVAGTSGTGKTVFAAQFLAGGISRCRQPGVFVTCEETPDEIRGNAAGLGLDIADWEQSGQWTFVDASPEPGQSGVESGRFDLEALMARIEYAIDRTGAGRVAIDSIGSLLTRFHDGRTLRDEFHRILTGLKALGVTVIVTAERSREDGPVVRHGIEEFVADNVIVLRNNHERRSRRRTVEILKFRGTDHVKGEWPYAILQNQGFQVVPHSGRLPRETGAHEKLSIGQKDLDDMMGGGVYTGSTVLVSGAPGTGKTLVSTHFASAADDTRCLLVAFEEGRPQLVRNAGGWGIDYESLESKGRLRILCHHPDVSGPEEQLIRIRNEVEEFKPTRVVVDGLSAIANSAGEQGNYDFVMGICALVRQYGLVCLLTSSTTSLLGGQSITECRASTLADAIIVLRYAEVCGAVTRCVTVLKVRGSSHSKDLREVEIDHLGMHIGRAFRNVTGVLSGQVAVITDDELARTHGVLEELAGNPA